MKRSRFVAEHMVNFEGHEVDVWVADPPCKEGVSDAPFKVKSQVRQHGRIGAGAGHDHDAPRVLGPLAASSLSGLICQRGRLPEALVSDNGTEYTSTSIMQWADL
jgi:hypothetical protein